MNITRRDALLGATAAAVVTGAITVPLALKASSVKAALGGDPVNTALQRAHAEWERARQAFLRALDDLAPVERRFWDTANERGIKCGTRAYEALGRELGVDAAHDREHRACHEDWASYERLLNTPADSVQDMVLKRQVALIQEDRAAEETLVRALFRDLERLAWRAAS